MTTPQEAAGRARQVEVRVSPFLPDDVGMVTAHSEDGVLDYLIVSSSTKPETLKLIQETVDAHNGFVRSMAFIQEQIAAAMPVWTDNLRKFEAALGETLVPAMERAAAGMTELARQLGLLKKRQRQYAKLAEIQRGTQRRRR